MGGARTGDGPRSTRKTPQVMFETTEILRCDETFHDQSQIVHGICQKRAFKSVSASTKYSHRRKVRGAYPQTEHIVPGSQERCLGRKYGAETRNQTGPHYSLNRKIAETGGRGEGWGRGAVERERRKNRQFGLLNGSVLDQQGTWKN